MYQPQTASSIWKPNVTVAAVIEADGRFLLVEESIRGQLVLNQPAGHLEENESLIDAVIRETIEESAWSFSPQALCGVYLWRKPASPTTYLRATFTGEATAHDPHRRLDDGIVRAVWLTVAELHAAQERWRSPLVGRAVTDYLTGERYPLTLLKTLLHEAV